MQLRTSIFVQWITLATGTIVTGSHQRGEGAMDGAQSDTI